MAYVVWKMHGRHGPYAYLRESVRVDGRVRPRHICYLGRFREGDPGSVLPGSVVTAPTGESVRVPPFSPAVLRRMRPAPSEGSAAGLGTTRPDLACSDLVTMDTPTEAGLGTTAPADIHTQLGTTAPDSPPTGTEADLGTTTMAPSLLETTDTAEKLGTTETTVVPSLGCTPAVGDEEGQTTSRIAAARPRRLSDRSWGIISQEQLAVGDQVRVTTSGGESWTARITEVLERSQRGTVARTTGRP